MRNYYVFSFLYPCVQTVKINSNGKIANPSIIFLNDDFKLVSSIKLNSKLVKLLCFKLFLSCILSAEN